MDKILNLTLPEPPVSLPIGKSSPSSNLIPPEPLNRGADQIFSFCVPPKRGSEKIIYCSKIGSTEHDWRLNEWLNILYLQNIIIKTISY